jgi:hypothetical protein
VTAQDFAAFLQAHPLETVLAALGINILGIMAIAWVARKLTERDG